MVIEGRFQSRMYTKLTEQGPVQRTAYEVSVMHLLDRITSYNVCYTKLLRLSMIGAALGIEGSDFPAHLAAEADHHVP